MDVVRVRLIGLATFALALIALAGVVGASADETVAYSFKVSSGAPASPPSPAPVLKDLATMNEELNTVIGELGNGEIKGAALRTSISRILKLKRDALGRFPPLPNGRKFADFYDLSEEVLTALAKSAFGVSDLGPAIHLVDLLIGESTATDEGKLPASVSEGLREVRSEIEHIANLSEAGGLSQKALEARIGKVRAKFRKVLESMPDVFGHPFLSVFDKLSSTDFYLESALTASSPMDSQTLLKGARSAKDGLEKLLNKPLAALPTGAGAGSSALPCRTVIYVTSIPGETGVETGDCTSRFTEIGILFNFLPCNSTRLTSSVSTPSCQAPPVTKVSNWAVLSKTGMNTGACTKSGNSLECKLNNPMPLTSTFTVAFAPPLKAGEKIVFNLTSSTGKVVTVPVTVPAGPKLTVTGTMTANTSGGAVAGTSFTVDLKVAGGPFQNFFFDMTYTGLNPGNSGPTAVTTSLSCGTQASPLGANHNRWICNTFKVFSDPPGSYSFVANFQNPVPSGTVLKGHITGTGVGAPAEFELKTP